MNAIGTQLRDPIYSGLTRWHGSKKYVDAAAEIGRNPVIKHQIQPEYGDEQADAGRDCRTRLARPNFSGANADREILIFPVQLTTSRIGNLTRLVRTLAVCDDHTYIRTYIPSSALHEMTSIARPTNESRGSF